MEKEYYIVVNDERVGPLSLNQLAERGIEPSTLVWTAGLSDWTRADCVPALESLLSMQQRVDESESAFGAYARPEENTKPWQNNRQPYGNPSGYGQPYQQGDPYGNRRMDNRGSSPFESGVNWKTLSIIATVAGFLFSCIGGILGIFAILAANKAENAYMTGDDITARSSLSNCKTLTIISFVLTAIGLIANVAVLSNMTKFGLSSLGM